MSLVFNGTTQRLSYTGAIPFGRVAQPFAVSVWFNPRIVWTSSSTWTSLIAVRHNTWSNGDWDFELEGNGSATKLRLWTYQDGWSMVEATPDVVAGRWQHAFFLVDTAGVCYVSLNGTAFVASTIFATRPATDYDSMVIAGSDAFHDGALANVAAWVNCRMSFPDVVSLSRGADPRGIKRGTLSSYWQMPGGEAVARDIIGGRHAALVNAPVKGASDPVIRRARDAMDGLTGRTLFFAAVDETSPNDTDYVYTLTPNAVVEFALSSVTDPASSTGHIVRVRARSPYGQRAKFSLYQSTTLIAEWTDTLTASFAPYEHTLTGGETDSISDYAALRIRITALSGT